LYSPVFPEKESRRAASAWQRFDQKKNIVRICEEALSDKQVVW
jgi:hypothetical protein